MSQAGLLTHASHSDAGVTSQSHHHGRAVIALRCDWLMRPSQSTVRCSITPATSRHAALELPQRETWKTRPSWYLVVTEDGMIPPPAQRQMAARAGATIAEAAGSHSIYISNPERMAALIDKAANSVSCKARA